MNTHALRFTKAVGAAALVCLLASVGVMGQSFTASLIGEVTDASGAAIPNVSIAATNVSNNVKIEARSDATGRFVVSQLQPGSYRIEASAQGFKKFVQSGVQLAVGQQARLDIAMAVGEVTENVTVEASVSTIETSTSTVGKVVSNKSILNLPLNSRNIYSLIYLTPGVAGSIGNNYNSMSYSINGARASMMDTLIDGATASHPTVQGYSGISAFPSVDAIGEFKVLGANFPAEYGRTAGSVLNVVYKSGTNDFHGTAYEFLRNSKLDANTFYNNLRSVPLSSFKRSQYGGTFGGPIIRDKSFFMSSYEGLRQRSFSQRTTTVPTALERAGDFTQTYAGANNQVLIFDPFTTRANPSGSGFIRDPFSGNVIPSARFDKVGAAVAKTIRSRTHRAPLIPTRTTITTRDRPHSTSTRSMGALITTSLPPSGCLSGTRTATRTACPRFSGRRNSRQRRRPTTNATGCITASSTTP